MAINEGKEFEVLQCVAESGRKIGWFTAVLESQSILTRTTCCVSEQLQGICGAPADGGEYCCGWRVLPDITLEPELSSSAWNTASQFSVKK